MIARLQINKENRKFVVRDRRYGFYLEGPHSASADIDGAKVYDSKSAAEKDLGFVCDQTHWEVEQIVVC